MNLIHQPNIKTFGIAVINQMRYTAGYARQPTNILYNGLNLTLLAVGFRQQPVAHMAKEPLVAALHLGRVT